MNHTLLVVDDEQGVRFGIRAFMEEHGYTVLEAETAAVARTLCANHRPDIVLLDFRLPDGTALELLPVLRETDPDLPIIILTAHGSIDLAVRAIKEGAEQFLTKPVELTALLSVIQRVQEHGRLKRTQRAKRASVVDPFVGSSPAIRQLRSEATRVAAADSAVLIQGETGSGKGVLARWLHANSQRSQEAYVDLNCAALSRELLESELFGYEKGAFTGASMAKVGLFEVAHRGTLFLDEIGDIDSAVQAKLLKAVEEKRFHRLGGVRDIVVDARLLTATHQDLNAWVAARKFRADLLYRINTFVLRVPPLRERVDDIEAIAQQLLASMSCSSVRGTLTLSPETVQRLRRHSWPGNVRELRNVLERAVILAGSQEIGVQHLRFDTIAPPDGGGERPMTLEQVEAEHIRRVLELQEGSMSEAARQLGISRSSLYQKIARYKIDVSTK